MATSILQSVRGRRSNGRLHDIEATVEDQIESLRDEIAALTKSLSKSVSKTGSEHGQKIRSQAEAGLEDLMERSELLLRDIQDGYMRGAREMRETVRRHPAATIGAAAAVGIVLALLARR